MNSDIERDRQTERLELEIETLGVALQLLNECKTVTDAWNVIVREIDARKAELSKWDAGPTDVVLPSGVTLKNVPAGTWAPGMPVPRK